MSKLDCPYGFRILGPCSNERRCTKASEAFEAYCRCDIRIETETETYLSAFSFPEPFAQHLRQSGSTKDYRGVCDADWIWWDIDEPEELENALDGARRLCANLGSDFGVLDEHLLVFFSGAKGFHLGIPTPLWDPKPSLQFHRITRSFCETVAAHAGVNIDLSIYDRVRAFRAPNSRHPKSGLFKRRFTADELLHVKLEKMLEMAREPEEFEPPSAIFHEHDNMLGAAWQEASITVVNSVSTFADRKANQGEKIELNRFTLDFIREGANTGERATRLFSAAANLAEFGCPSRLASALLREAALDSGLTPSEIQRQIECGIAQGGRKNGI